MTGAIGFLETMGLTPAMVALDTMIKSAAIRVLQVELNDLCGVCVKITGATADVQSAINAGRRTAESLHGHPVATVLNRVAEAAGPAIRTPAEFSPLIQQAVVFSEPDPPESHPLQSIPMNEPVPAALGFIETQGFTAVFEAIDTACKAADVEVVGKEKLGGGYVTVVIQGELSAVSAAVATGREKVEGLGKLVAAHVIARPSTAVLRLLPRL